MRGPKTRNRLEKEAATAAASPKSKRLWRLARDRVAPLQSIRQEATVGLRSRPSGWDHLFRKHQGSHRPGSVRGMFGLMKTSAVAGEHAVEHAAVAAASAALAVAESVLSHAGRLVGAVRRSPSPTKARLARDGSSLESTAHYPSPQPHRRTSFVSRASFRLPSGLHSGSSFRSSSGSGSHKALRVANGAVASTPEPSDAHGEHSHSRRSHHHPHGDGHHFDFHHHSARSSHGSHGSHRGSSRRLHLSERSIDAEEAVAVNAESEGAASGAGGLLRSFGGENVDGGAGALGGTRKRIDFDETDAAIARSAVAVAEEAAASAAKGAVAEGPEAEGPARGRKAGAAGAAGAAVHSAALGQASVGWRGSHRDFAIVDGVHEHREALAERRRLRLLPEIQECVSKLWAIGVKGHAQRMNLQSYMNYHLSVYYFVAALEQGLAVCALDEEIDLYEAWDTAISDWRSDTHAVAHLKSQTLHFDAFRDSVFELIDMYTTTTKPKQYIGYMRRLVKKISIADELGTPVRWSNPWPKASDGELAAKVRAVLRPEPLNSASGIRACEKTVERTFAAWLEAQEAARRKARQEEAEEEGEELEDPDEGFTPYDELTPHGLSLGYDALAALHPSLPPDPGQRAIVSLMRVLDVDFNGTLSAADLKAAVLHKAKSEWVAPKDSRRQGSKSGLAGLSKVIRRTGEAVLAVGHNR